MFRVWFLLPASILSGFLDFIYNSDWGLTGSLVGSDLEIFFLELKYLEQVYTSVFMVNCYFYSQLASVGCPFSTSLNARKSRWRVMA